MAQELTKATRRELARQIADRRSAVPEIEMVAQLVDALLDETKDRMVTALESQLVAMQGRAKAFADLREMLIRSVQL